MLILTEQSPGAPECSPVYGRLCDILDWALPQANWEIEFTDTHKRIYRPPAGTRNRLYVNHANGEAPESSRAIVRGCESASDINTRVNEFPNVTQVANTLSCWQTGINSSTSGFPYRLYVEDKWFYFLRANSNVYSDSIYWDIHFFGDLEPSYLNDNYCCACFVKNDSDDNAGEMLFADRCHEFPYASNNNLFFARDITGTLISPWASVHGAPRFNSTGNMPAPRTGYLNRIWMERAYVHDSGFTYNNPIGHSPNALYKRAQFPRIYRPLHDDGLGALSYRTVFQSSAYNPLAQFRVLPCSTLAFAIFEETDTWTPEAPK